MNDRAAQALGHFMNKGWTREQAAGIVGNLIQESSMNADSRNVGDGTDGSDSIGMGQWNRGRAKALHAFAESKGTAWNDFGTQLDFLDHELRTSPDERVALTRLQNAKTVDEATAAMIGYERPRGYSHANPQAGDGWGNRLNGARQTLGMEPISLDPVTVAAVPPPAPYSMSRPLQTEPLWIADPGAFQAQPEPQDRGWVQPVVDAMGEQQTLSWVWDSMNAETRYDPDYRLDETRLDKDLEDNGLDPEFYAGWFSKAYSEDRYQGLLRAAVEDNARTQSLDADGTYGTIARIASSILDPVALTAEALSAGTATAVLGGAKGIRLGRALSGAVGGAAGAGAATGVQAAVNPHVDAADAILDTAVGAGFGAVIGKLLGNPGARQEAAAIQRALTSGPEPDATVFGGRSIGAAQNPAVAMPELDNVALASVGEADAPKSFLGTLRLDNAGKIKASPNPAARLVFGSLAKDAAGNADDVVQGFSRHEDMDRIFTGWNVDLAHTYNPQLRTFLKDQRKAGVRMSDEDATILFNDQIDLLKRDRDALPEDFHPAVVKVVEKMRKLDREILADAQNPLRREGRTGRPIAGFADVPENPNYMVRVFDAKKITTFRDTFGDNGLSEVIAAGLRGAGHEMDDAKLLKVAKGFAKAIKDRALGLQDADPVNLSEDGLAKLRTVLLDESGLEEADVDAILAPLKRSDTASGTPRGKTRMLLDETAKARVVGKDGMEEVKTLRDLIVTDAHALSMRYMRQMAGQVAMGRWQVFHPRTGELIVNGVTNRAEWDAVVRDVTRAAVDRGVEQGQRDMDAKRATFLYDSIVGNPTGGLEDQSLAEWVRVLQAANYARLMGQVGFAQIPEIAGIVSRLGIKATFAHVSAFRRIITTDTGEELLANGFARDLETFLPSGVDSFTRSDFHRTDELAGSPHSLTRGTTANKVLAKLDTMNRWVSKVSGMDLIQGANEKLAAAGIVQRFVDAAHGTAKLQGPWRRQMGLSDAMVDRIMANLRDPANITTERGALTGNTVVRLSNAWADKEAYAAFQDAAHRISRQIIQRNDPGMMAMWMSKPLGAIIMQFRRFSFGALTNNLLFNVNMARRGDMRAMSYFMMSSMMAAAVYAAQEKIRSIGRSDREDYLDERLSWDAIAKAAFARSGYSSILPMMLDSPPFSTMTGGGIFDYRSSGQPSTGWTSNPTVSLLDDFQRGSRGIVAPIFEGRPITQQEARSITRVVPLGNTLPAVLGLNGLISGLDERPPRQYRD